jgi:preprotein translocase subunit SecE
MATEVKAMELKKTPSTTTVKEPAITGRGIIDFVGDIKEEFGKITWTNPNELRTYTKIVVGMTFFLGMGIYLVDFSIQTVLSILSFLFHSIFG